MRRRDTTEEELDDPSGNDTDDDKVWLFLPELLLL